MFKKIGIVSVPLAALVGVVVLLSVHAAAPLTNPTHFDDTYWYWPASPQGYTQMDTNITPQADGSPDGYFLASGFWLANDSSGYGGYMGLQTESTTAGTSGKVASFTIYNATSVTGPGTNVSGKDNGQPYYSSTIRYNWQIKHVYDLRIYLSSGSIGGHFLTWTGEVIDKTAGTTSVIGNITTLSNYEYLKDESYSFHERYSGGTTSCSDLHKSEVEFTSPTASGGSVKPTGHSNASPTTGCNGDFATRNISGGVQSIVGGNFSTSTTTKPKSGKTSSSSSTKSSGSTSSSSSSGARTSTRSSKTPATGTNNGQPNSNSTGTDTGTGNGNTSQTDSTGLPIQNPDSNSKSTSKNKHKSSSLPVIIGIITAIIVLVAASIFSIRVVQRSNARPHHASPDPDLFPHAEGVKRKNYPDDPDLYSQYGLTTEDQPAHTKKNRR